MKIWKGRFGQGAKRVAAAAGPIAAAAVPIIVEVASKVAQDWAKQKQRKKPGPTG